MTVVQLWMAAVLLTGPNPPSLSWSFRTGVAGCPRHRYKPPLSSEYSCTSVAIIHLFTWRTSIHALRKSINIVAMPMDYMLLRHFKKGMFNGGIGAVAYSYLLCTLGSIYHTLRAIM